MAFYLKPDPSPIFCLFKKKFTYYWGVYLNVEYAIFSLLFYHLHAKFWSFSTVLPIKFSYIRMEDSILACKLDSWVLSPTL